MIYIKQFDNIISLIVLKIENLLYLFKNNRFIKV